MGRPRLGVHAGNEGIDLEVDFVEPGLGSGARNPAPAGVRGNAISFQRVSKDFLFPASAQQLNQDQVCWACAYPAPIHTLPSIFLSWRDPPPHPPAPRASWSEQGPT